MMDGIISHILLQLVNIKYKYIITMHHNIKNVIIYFLIMFFMYVILLRETIIEGKKGAGIKKAVNKRKDKVD